MSSWPSVTVPQRRGPDRDDVSPVRRPGTFARAAAGLVLAAALCIGMVVAGQPAAAAATARAPAPDAAGSAAHAAAPVAVWPQSGQAAYQFAGHPAVVGPHQHRAPIASLAKVMTAYLVLRAHPLRAKYCGFRMHVTQADVRDTARRVALGESIVPVRAGEVLTECQALAALLLPSANNVAAMLARHLSGSVARFVRRMNVTARALGMRDTHYTDPSGFLASTRSTPRDQLRMAQTAMRLPSFAAMVHRTSYRIPVAGVVHNLDQLLGHDGFVGIKTGSESASGGCFVFRTVRVVDHRRVVLTGVVLGQPGPDLIGAALDAARMLAARARPSTAGPAGAPAGLGSAAATAPYSTDTHRAAPPVTVLRTGHALRPGTQLRSANGKYRLSLRPTGRLVVLSGTRVVWHSSLAGTEGHRTPILHLTTAGNLAVWSRGTLLWQARTTGSGRPHLWLTDAGGLQLATAAGTVWSSWLGNRCGGSQPAHRVVVSIAEQRAWLCAGHQQVLMTRVTTGASALGEGTPTGTWQVYAKVRNTVLYPSSGGAYPVHYWMPYSGPYGMHDSPWQTFPYGSGKYRRQGSHGCVHFPGPAMKRLFAWAPVWTTVTIRG